MKKLLKIILILILSVVVVMGGLCAFLTITEFKPDAITVLEPTGAPEYAELYDGATLKLITWNVGYAGQSADMDLVDQGGESTHAATESMVNKNLEGVRYVMRQEYPDVILLQQIDAKASRSFNVDEITYMESTFPGVATYAQNYVCKFIPIPLEAPRGAVDSGLLTINKYQPAEASRNALAAGYTWPMKLFEPKNCISVQRIQLGSAENPQETQLVIINIECDSKDDGAIKIEQTKELATFMKDEYAKGNYVIAGGTFNQTFPGSDSTRYPIRNIGFFMPGIVEQTLFGDDWTFAYDEKVPTARLLNTPYNEYDPYMQLYVIDGFIASPNITVTRCKTIDTEFKYSSHQPVTATICLGDAVPEPQVDANGNVVTTDGAITNQNGNAANATNAYNNGGYAIGEGVLQTDGQVYEGIN